MDLTVMEVVMQRMDLAVIEMEMQRMDLGEEKGWCMDLIEEV